MKKVPEILIGICTIFAASCGQNTVNSIDLHNPGNTITEMGSITSDSCRLSSTEYPLVLRTDFSNDKEWETICKEIVTPEPEFGFLPCVVFANDTSFQDFFEEQLLSDSTSEYDYAFIFFIDSITVSNPEHPILCVGLKHNKGLKFRTIPSEMWAIENNLSISNMDFEDFSDAVDKDGVYRGL